MFAKFSDYIRRIIDRYFLYVFILIVILLSASVMRSFTKLKNAESIVREAEVRVSEIEKDNRELEERLEMVRSEEFVEQQLRDKLGLAREGEIVIILPEEDLVRKFAPQYKEEEVSPPLPNWKKWVKLFI